MVAGGAAVGGAGAAGGRTVGWKEKKVFPVVAAVVSSGAVVSGWRVVSAAGGEAGVGSRGATCVLCLGLVWTSDSEGSELCLPT